jgi:hypothetical protein
MASNEFEQFEHSADFESEGVADGAVVVADVVGVAGVVLLVAADEIADGRMVYQTIQHGGHRHLDCRNELTVYA